MLTVDQEGGQVAQLSAVVSPWPTMRALGSVGDPGLAERVGVAIGRELRALGVDVDWAPVLDVDTNPDNPIINDRALSGDPKAVAELGAALVRGLQSVGVGACGKHFPGHGDTEIDSHLALPFIGHDPERLREIEWPPFTAAIAAGVGAIMTAHVVIEALDPDHPATVSQRTLAVLREEMGFGGVIVSDGIEMKALSERYSPQQIVTLGLNAGVDLFLACDPDGVMEHYLGLVHAVEQEEISHETLLEAARRVERWRRRFYRGPGSEEAIQRWVRCGEHQGLVEEIEERAGEAWG